jgi:hypothetical protein
MPGSFSNIYPMLEANNQENRGIQMPAQPSTLLANVTLNASSYERQWRIALSSFKAHNTSIATIERLHTQWGIPYDLNALAAIVGAIYANQYWNGVQMDATLLKNDLTAAGATGSDADAGMQNALLFNPGTGCWSEKLNQIVGEFREAYTPTVWT